MTVSDLRKSHGKPMHTCTQIAIHVRSYYILYNRACSPLSMNGEADVGS